MSTMFSNATSWVMGRFQRDAIRRIAFNVKPDHVVSADGMVARNRALKAGEHYFRLWLSEMFLEKDRNWFSEWYPAVHSAITIEYGDQPPLAVTRVASPNNLTHLGANDLSKVVMENIDLCALVPFNGGKIEIAAALLAMKGGNDVEKLIGVMADLSKKFALAQLSGALDIASSVATGIGALVGATDGAMMTGMSRVYSRDDADQENALCEGYFIAVDANETELDRSKIWIKSGQAHYGDSPQTSQRLTKHSYILLRLECADTRDDFDSLSAIKEPYSSAVDMLSLGQMESANAFLKKAIAAALKAPELTSKVDRRRVIEEIKLQFADAKSQFGEGSFKEDTLIGALNDLMTRAGAMTAETAAGMPTLRTIDDAYQGL